MDTDISQQKTDPLQPAPPLMATKLPSGILQHSSFLSPKSSTGEEDKASTVPAQLSKQSLSSKLPGLRKILQAANNSLLYSRQGFMARNALSASEGLCQKAARELAALEAERAYKHVAAYKDLIDSTLGGWPDGGNFSDLPVTSKKNYILPNLEKDELALYIDNQIPAGASWDTSTGTSGNPVSWYRGISEVAATQRLMAYRAKTVLNCKSYSFINGFALGPWATGTTAARGIGNDKIAVTYNPGPNPEEMLRLIKESLTLTPDNPIIVAGYPPHVEELVELARSQNISFANQQTFAIVGGEAMSESQRRRILDQDSNNPVFGEVFSFYGASDIDINLAFETPFEIELRKAMLENPGLSSQILGESPAFVPMVFHYDPLNQLIEVDENKQLLYTELSGQRISPRIRYNLGDNGTVKPLSEVMSILKESGVSLPVSPRTSQPLLFLWGRVDDGITYRGANLAWENLEEALRNVSWGQEVKDFGLLQHEDHQGLHTEFLLQISDMESFTTATHQGKRLLEELIKEISALNPDFNKQVEEVRNLTDYPNLRIYQSDSPMAKHRREYPARKRKHIFLDADTESAFKINDGGKVFSLASQKYYF